MTGKGRCENENLKERVKKTRTGREKKKTCLGNENTKAEVQVVGVEQCHERDRD